MEWLVSNKHEEALDHSSRCYYHRRIYRLKRLEKYGRKPIGG